MAYTSYLKEFPLRMEKVGKADRIKLFASASTTYYQGQPVVVTNGKAAAAAAAGANTVGTVRTGVTTTAATTAGPQMVEVDLYKELDVYKAGCEVPYEDDVACTYVSSNNIGFGTNMVGANQAVDNSIRYNVLVHMKTGQYRLINAYDAAGGAADQLCTIDFTIAGAAVGDKFCVLGTGTDGQGLFPGSPCDLGAVDPVKVALNDIAGHMIVLDLSGIYRGYILVTPTDLLFQAP